MKKQKVKAIKTLSKFQNPRAQKLDKCSLVKVKGGDWIVIDNFDL